MAECYLKCLQMHILIYFSAFQLFLSGRLCRESMLFRSGVVSPLFGIPGKKTTRKCDWNLKTIVFVKEAGRIEAGGFHPLPGHVNISVLKRYLL